MGKKADLVRRIAEQGCGGVDCGRDGCPFSDGSTCEPYRLNDLDQSSPSIKAQAREWLEARAKRKAEKREREAKDQPITEMTVNGEVYKIGDRFRWVGLTDSIIAHGEIGTIAGFKDGKALMQGKPHTWAHWIKEFWQRVTEPEAPAEPAWNGEFVPGEFYRNYNGEIVRCMMGRSLGEDYFYGFRVNGLVHGDDTAMRWVRNHFIPVKVNITVEE